MKRGVILLLLAAVLALSGCTAMLERAYTKEEPATDRFTTGEDPSVAEVENRSALTSAVLSLVRQGAERGVIRLKNYRGDAESDLSDACLEVALRDPLGSYAVESIKHECVHIISYYEATLSITYRRTGEQVAAISKVTGSGAIRTELRSALTAFSQEVVLQISYFAEDEEYIRALISQAYYDCPSAALGMPEATVTLYPAQTQGYQRIVEIQLSYPDSPEALRKKSAQLDTAAQRLCAPLLGLSGAELFPTLAAALQSSAAYLPPQPSDQVLPTPTPDPMLPAAPSPTPGAISTPTPPPAPAPVRSTAYHALVQGSADSEGFALATALLCRQLGVECIVVSGAVDGVPHFWNVVHLSGREYRHFDVTADGAPLLSDARAMLLGYVWDRTSAAIPLCGEQPPQPTPTAPLPSPGGDSGTLPDGQALPSDAGG